MSNDSRSDAEQRAEFLTFLEELEAALKLPPQEGYRRRCSYITIEDECDAGSSSELPWELDQADIDMLRAALRGATPSSELATARYETAMKCAEICDNAFNSAHPDDIAEAIRAYAETPKPD